MIEGVFWFLFGVLVGGLGFFGGTFLLVVMFLKRLNSASENAGAASRIASRRIGLNLELAGNLKLQTRLDDLTEDSSTLRTKPLLYAVLKEGTLFTYSDDKRRDKMVLDGCQIRLTNKTNWGAKSNCIELSHPDRVLLFTPDPTGAGPPTPHKSCRLYFENGKELEEWYYALRRAVLLAVNPEAIYEQEAQILQTFSHLSQALQPHFGESDSGAWFNAILSRFWWNLHENPHFRQLIMNSLGKRISRMTNFPKFIESMSLERIYIGPNIPLLSNLSLVSVSKQGEVIVDADVEYDGGFSMSVSLNTKVTLPATSFEMPASAVLSVERLSGRLRVHIAPPPCERFWAGFHVEPIIDVTCETEIGVSSNIRAIRNIPKIANTFVQKIRADITNMLANKIKSDLVNEKMVLPRMDDFPIPYWGSPNDGSEREGDAPVAIVTRDEEPQLALPAAKSRAPLLRISPHGVSIWNQKFFTTTPTAELQATMSAPPGIAAAAAAAAAAGGGANAAAANAAAGGGGVGSGAGGSTTALSYAANASPPGSPRDHSASGDESSDDEYSHSVMFELDGNEGSGVSGGSAAGRALQFRRNRAQSTLDSQMVNASVPVRRRSFGQSDELGGVPLGSSPPESASSSLLVSNSTSPPNSRKRRKEAKKEAKKEKEKANKEAKKEAKDKKKQQLP